MDYNNLLSYLKKRQPDFVTLLQKLVSFQTYTGERENINKFLDFLENLFAGFDPQVSRFQTGQGDILTLSFFPRGADKEVPDADFIVLLAHVDTVKVSQIQPPAKIKGDRFFANGCYDMKNAIALFYYALKALKHFDAAVNKQIKMVLTPDEEAGSEASLPILLRECSRAAAVILPEPCCPGGGVKTRRKGVITMQAKLKGKAVHSGIEPEKGIDANRALAQLIGKIDKIAREVGAVSFNPGILSGGTSRNVVSPFSCMDFELRSYSSGLLKKALREIKKIGYIGGAGCEIVKGIEHPALEFDHKNRRIYEIAVKIASSLGYELSAGSSGGGSEGSHLSFAGIPVIDGLGMKGGAAHSPGEYIEMADFPFRAALITALCLEV
ncbi:MAG: M20/M25/M40 family metallo-hydrolase [Candidatus Aminicenantes bacterium]|nr:M20/M25/M40 family metallo-hydrolase [Candidatus Aminicenantes bacterium]